MESDSDDIRKHPELCLFVHFQLVMDDEKVPNLI